MGKYDRLRDHLQSLSETAWNPTFSELETILQQKLPPSARTYVEWWSNTLTGGPQAASWLGAGWRAENLNLRGEQVTFRRTAGTTTVKSRERTARSHSESPVHDWDSPDLMECSVHMKWTPLGRVVLDGKEKLAFPTAPQQPGLYRFRIRRGESESVYFGESDNLSRRFGNYRNPGSTQPTNLRLNGVFREFLASGAEIAVAVVTTSVWIERSGSKQSPDLSSKAMRCFLENAAIVLGRGDGIDSLNRAEAAWDRQRS